MWREEPIDGIAKTVSIIRVDVKCESDYAVANKTKVSIRKHSTKEVKKEFNITYVPRHMAPSR